MPLTSELKEWKIKPLPGMNAKIEDLELNEKWVEKAQNCRFEGEPGSVDKRRPVTYYNSSSQGSGGVYGLYRFYSKTGVIKSIEIWGTNAYVGDDSAGTFASIRANLTTGKRMAFKTYKDLIICSNGYDNPFVYDGSSDNVTWELGACKALTIAGGANLDASANYYYAVTIDNDAYVCGAVSNTVTTGIAGGNRKVTLSNIPTGPIGTANRKIYRTDGGGVALKLLATIADNTTTTYVDDIADGTLGAALPAVTDDMPLGSILQLHRERIFISGDPNSPNRIYFSDPYLPWFIQQTTNLAYLDIDADDGDEIMGIPIQLGILICVKKNTIRKVYITSPTSGADPDTWYAEDPISFTGSPAQWSIVQSQHGVIFLGWDHWKIFDGSTVSDIIDEFDCDDILPTHYNQVVAYWLQDDILLAGYTSTEGATQYNDRLMRYSFKRQTLSYDTLHVNCISAHTGDDETGDVLFGDSHVGYVYKTEITDILYKLQTKTQANAGTLNATYAGGTEALPYIQIGSITTASAIPNDVCIFWDNALTNPGVGWSEVTTVYDKFIKISTATLLTTGSISISNGADTTINFHKYRLFKKIAGTTEYEFPDGSIVMYDQPSTPNGFITVGTGGFYIQLNATPGADSVQLTAATGAGGTNLDQTLAFRFIKKVGEADTWDGVSTYVYCLYATSGAPGNGFTDVTSTYSGDYLTVGTGSPTVTTGAVTTVTDFLQMGSTTHTYSGGNVGTGPETIDGNTATYYQHSGSDTATGSGGSFGSSGTVISEHSFSTSRDVTSVSFRVYGTSTASSGSSNSAQVRYNIQYELASAPGTWVDFAGGTGTSTGSNTTVTVGSTTVTTTLSVSVSNVKSVRAQVTSSGSYHNDTGSHSWTVSIYEFSVSGTFGSFVTLRLLKKVLGQMKDYNTAISSSLTKGTWISPGLQINAETLGDIAWNESKLSTDDIEFYTRTGATQASVESGTSITTVTNATNKFTLAGNGLANTNRITIDATVMPTGLLKTVVYFVVGVSGNDWQVSLTSGGSAVDFSTDGTAVTFKKWSAPLSDPNGSAVASTANVWIQYLIAFTAADTQVANPKVYFAGGYVVKFNYSKGKTYAETAVEFIYRTGFRHFDQPWADKIFKKILSYHAGEQGQVLINWETEFETGTFTVDLTNNQQRFESFFPANAFGRKLSLEFYKNDLYDYKLKEISGLFTPEPVIV